ncbi:MAG TPA: hypothetical protein VJK47_03425 [Dehalococcoidales bacterium]|nr:hypothetical protein [Dehalococcoidales bacterium]
MEMDRFARLELLEYRKALVKGLKTNLLKSFWRLAYVTYDTIAGKAGFGGGSLGLKGGSIAVGETYAKLFSDAGVIEKLGSALKVMRALSPGNSKLAINTDSIAGKLKSTGLSAALDAVESLGDPQAVAQTIFSSTAEQLLPSTAELSEEEVEILRSQALDKRKLDDVLQESYRVNSDRRRQVETLPAENKSLDAELQRWEQAEKERVARELEAAWKAKK